MSEDPYRPLSDAEMKILEKLISGIPFGRDFLVRQLTTARVRVIDEYGSLGFLTASEFSPADEIRPLIMARQLDSNTIPMHGPYINIILFMRACTISEIQIFKDDGRPVMTNIDPDKFELIYGIHPKNEIGELSRCC